MKRTQQLSHDDLSEALVADTLLVSDQGVYLVVAFRAESGHEYVDYHEASDEDAARAIAIELRSKGSEVAIWRRVD